MPRLYKYKKVLFKPIFNDNYKLISQILYNIACSYEMLFYIQGYALYIGLVHFNCYHRLYFTINNFQF